MQKCLDGASSFKAHVAEIWVPPQMSQTSAISRQVEAMCRALIAWHLKHRHGSGMSLRVMQRLLQMYRQLRMALLASSAVRNVAIIYAVRCPSKRRSMGFIHRVSRIAFAGRLLKVSTSRADSSDRRNPMGTFSTTHENSLSFISDIALKPCRNSVRISSFLSQSANVVDSMSKRMSPFASWVALMN